jgi:hypothetical protein
MSYCWKCEKELPDGVIECPEHCTTQTTYSEGLAIRRVDWAKVQTLDDIKKIFKVFGMQVVTDSPAEDALRDYLED